MASSRRCRCRGTGRQTRRRAVGVVIGKKPIEPRSAEARKRCRSGLDGKPFEHYQAAGLNRLASSLHLHHTHSAAACGLDARIGAHRRDRNPCPPGCGRTLSPVLASISMPSMVMRQARGWGAGRSSLSMASRHPPAGLQAHYSHTSSNPLTNWNAALARWKDRQLIALPPIAVLGR